MTIQEMEKKKGFFGKSYAVMISTAPKDAQEFMSEWRQIGSALVEWKARRKKEAETVILTVVSDPANHAEFKGIINKIYAEEATLSPLLKALKVNVVLLNTRGQPQEEYALGN